MYLFLYYNLRYYYRVIQPFKWYYSTTEKKGHKNTNDYSNRSCCGSLLLCHIIAISCEMYLPTSGGSGISLSTGTLVGISCKVGDGENSKPVLVGIPFGFSSGMKSNSRWLRRLRSCVVQLPHSLRGQVL